MSWLSDSFSNLKGQISSLKDVLSEGREEVKDFEAEYEAASRRIRELEAISSGLRSEIETLRLANAELEERCQSSELQVGCLTSQCRSFIQNQSQAFPEENGEDGPHPLYSRIQELESQLHTITDQHQMELATLQDHYSQQLATLRSQQTPPTEQARENGTASIEELLHQRGELEAKVARLETDKQVLEQSLVELDQQNQEAIAEILQVKQHLQEENQKLQAQVEALRGQDSTDGYLKELESQLKQSQLDVERLTCEASGARSEVQSLQLQVEEQSRELDVLREEKLNSEETLNNLENTHLLQLQSCRDELNEVRLAQSRMEGTLRNKIEGLTQEAASLEAERDELDTQLEEARAEIESLKALLQQPLGTDISTQADEVSSASGKSYQELEAEVAFLTNKLESIPSLEETFKEVEVQNICMEISSSRMEKVVQTDLAESDFPQKPYEDLEAEIEHLKVKVLEQELENKTLTTNLQNFIALLPLNLPSNNHCLSIKDLLAEVDLAKELKSHLEKDAQQKSYIQEVEVALKQKEGERLAFLKEIEFKNGELTILQQKLLELTSQIKTLEEKSKLDNSLASKTKELEVKLSQMELEKEQMLSVLSEKSRECSNLKAEVHRLVDVVIAEKKALEKLQSDNQSLSKVMPESNDDRETIENLNKIIQEKDGEIKILQKKASNLSINQSTPEQSISDVDSESIQDPHLERENTELKARIAQLEQDLAKLEEKCRQAETKWVAESTKSGELQREFQVLSQQYESKQKSLLESSRETILMKQKITEREQLYEELLNQYKESQKNLQETAAKFLRESQELRQYIGQQEQLLTEQRGHLAKLQQELLEVRAQLQVKESEVDNFNQGLLNMFPPKSTMGEGAVIETSRSPLENLQELVKERNQLLTEVDVVKDREGKLLKELERLKEHLLHIEESYTQEALRAEEREVELRSQVAQLEEARAERVAEQRDAALAQVSALEDRLQRTAADLANLQLVLDHFHRDRARELDRLRDHHAAELATLRAEAESVRTELAATQQRLTQAASALDAAQRLSAQLDSKEVLLHDLHKEVEKKDKLLEKYLQESYSNTEGKVDRQILKNLVLNYLGAPETHRADVVRILAKVLDFNDTEMEKAGIRVGKDSSWWNKASVSDAADNQPSLSSAFVKFLEAESQPKKPPLKLPIDRKDPSAFKLK